ncbi:hypothetical protein ACH47Z_45750 [Streptomyces sp. NPDC020192]|uniref:hypothetical protein n=1 Tax=Streptomyces sp. NPDC020192 TaxID=3365066 RepID=UPI00378F195F
MTGRAGRSVRGPEHRAALALETAIDMTRDDIQGSFTHDTGLDRDLEDRRDAWNRLRCWFGQPWKDNPDFDTARWPRAMYIPLRGADERLPAQDRTAQNAAQLRDEAVYRRAPTEVVPVLERLAQERRTAPWQAKDLPATQLSDVFPALVPGR